MVRIAEETGGGKAILLERGAYKEMDACIMYSVDFIRNEGMLTLSRLGATPPLVPDNQHQQGRP